MEKEKKKYFFLLTIIIVGIITGIIFANILNTEDEKLVYDKITNYFFNIKNNDINYGSLFINSFYQNNLYLIIIWILGLSIIGLLLNIFITFFKSFIIGFSIGSIINIYLYKGLILSLVYVFPVMILNIIIILFLVYNANNISIKLFKLLFLKQDIKFKETIKRYFKILLISFIAFFISSLLETFVSPFLINLFTFLIN